jgi:hypothetical protein
MDMITLGDIEAMYDVLDQLGEQSDQIAPEDAIKLRAALTMLKRKAEVTLGLLQTAVVKATEEQPAGKWRPNQSKIKSRVVTMSSFNPITGETFDNVHAAAERAVDLMYALFVAPKDMPKKSGLEQLHLVNDDVADWERTGTEIVEKPA